MFFTLSPRERVGPAKREGEGGLLACAGRQSGALLTTHPAITNAPSPSHGFAAVPSLSRRERAKKVTAFASFARASRYVNLLTVVLAMGVRRLVLAALLALSLAACAARATEGPPLPETIAVRAGAFIAGSDRAEREMAYRLDEAAYGHSRTRKWQWYENEADRQKRETAGFRITRTPITNGQYAAFVAATGHPAPDVDPDTWAGYGLIHPYVRTRRHAWRDGKPPSGRTDHPVVMVSHGDAEAYAAWLSSVSGRAWRLPKEAEWEKAARGKGGRRYPWGDDWDPRLANSHDAGPFDTLPVGRFPAGASPFGLLDGAGQVFEWTATAAGGGRFIVKGGSWDDSGCGICRPAARHGRPAAIKHILIGFRLIVEQ